MVVIGLRPAGAKHEPIYRHLLQLPSYSGEPRTASVTHLHNFISPRCGSKREYKKAELN